MLAEADVDYKGFQTFIVWEQKEVSFREPVAL